MYTKAIMESKDIKKDLIVLLGLMAVIITGMISLKIYDDKTNRVGDIGKQLFEKVIK